MSVDPTLALYCASGVVAGTLYFAMLWWNARLFARRSGSWTGILLLPGRFAVMGCTLTLAAREGAMPLLAMALGVFIARFAVVRGLRGSVP